jgi:alpha-galactosidase
LRGLGSRTRFRVIDYVNDRPLGEVSAAANRLDVAFDRYLLLQAIPVTGARS